MRRQEIPPRLKINVTNCRAAELRERGHFLQPQAGLELERKIEEKINPFAAFMSECFVEDVGGPGVIVANFYAAFTEWCRENRRHDLVGSVPRQKLIQHVNGIKRWGLLKSTKAHGQPRRYPGIKRIPNNED
jgi:phage/plasmid-associated DNA primase